MFRSAYLSGKVLLFEYILGFFPEEKKAALIKEFAYDALYRSVLSAHMDMLEKIDRLLDTDELRSSILHRTSRESFFTAAVQGGKTQVCDWVRAIKTNDNETFLGMNVLGSAQLNHDLAMVDYLIEYAESSGKLKEFLSDCGYESLWMGAYYGDVDIFEHLVLKVPKADFVDFIQKGLYGGIFYSALAQGHEGVADSIEQYAKQYGCWEAIQEQTIRVKINELMQQSPRVIERFLETTHHLEEIDYGEITSFLSAKWQVLHRQPQSFLSNFPLQIDAVMQYAIQTKQTIDSDLLQVVDIEKFGAHWLDIAFKAKNEDFILSYLKLAGMFDKVYGDKSSKSKDYLTKAYPDECLTVSDRTDIKNTLDQALQYMGMKYTIDLKDNPIPSLKLSIPFQNSYAMNLFKTHLGLSWLEAEQFPCQQTIDIYRKHGEVDIQSLSENLNRIQAQYGFGNTDPGALVIHGISATMNSREQANIFAYTKTTRQGQAYFGLSIHQPLKMSPYEQEQLDKLLTLFSLICEKNGISKLMADADWIIKRKYPGSDTTYYEFNIQADDFHELMLKESDFYRGYRQSIYSVYQLAHPETQYYKPDTMCLFPVQPLEDEMIIRNAGCNVTEVLSVQLSALIQQLFDAYKTTFIGGHHQSKILEDFGLKPHEILIAALRCAGASPDYIAEHVGHEAFNGLNIIPLTEAYKPYIQDIDTSNFAIYGVSANLKSELSALKSFEVAMETYLSELKMVCEGNNQALANIEELKDKMQASHASKLRI